MKYIISLFIMTLLILNLNLIAKGETAKELIDKADTLYDQGNYGEAFIYYDKALAIDPENPHSWNRKGNCLYSRKKYEEALICYNKAIEKDPGYIKSWVNKGNILDDLDKFDEAMKCYNKAIELSPTYAKAWIDKGIALKKRYMYDDAVKCFDEALKLEPDNENTINLRASCFNTSSSSSSSSYNSSPCYIMKGGSTVATWENPYFYSGVKISTLGSFDGKYAYNSSGSTLGNISGKYIYVSGRTIGEIDGNYIKNSTGNVLYKIEGDYVNKSNGQSYIRLQGYDGSDTMKYMIVMYLFFFDN